MKLTLKRPKSKQFEELQKTPAYKTGFKKPPKEHMFKPGKSGNPNGRPSGKRNSASILREILASKITVKKNGKPYSIDKLTGAYIALVNKALGGDTKAISMLLSLVSSIEMKEEQKAQVIAALSKQDDFIIKNFIDRNKETPNESKP